MIPTTGEGLKKIWEVWVLWSGWFDMELPISLKTFSNSDILFLILKMLGFLYAEVIAMLFIFILLMSQMIYPFILGSYSKNLEKKKKFVKRTSKNII